jgi:hypothetical protein
MELLVEILGWVASVLIVGAYALNIRGKLPSNAPAYVWANLVGGAFFVVNTIFHGAYPSAVVNVIWVFIAIDTLLRQKQVGNGQK